MIVNRVSAICSLPIFYHLNDFIPEANIYLKIEGLNTAESIKLKTAKFLLNSLEKSCKLTPGVSKVIESSSGNLAIALSILCKERGYEFTCVIDPNILPGKERRLELYGAKLIKVLQKDASGGYLGTRIKTINDIIENDKNYVWTNQYANTANIQAHYCETAAEILAEIPQVDYLFVGAGTTGTLMGCAQYFRKYSPQTQIIAVDALGSVTFGYPTQRRLIPGIGTSRKPEIADPSLIDKVVLVDEQNTIKTCRLLLEKYGLFLGGSSGSVMYAIQAMQEVLNKQAVIVTISPDFGAHYQDTVYDDTWVASHYERQVVL